MPDSSAWEVRDIGPDTDISHPGYRLRISGTCVVVEDYWLPEGVEIELGGEDGEPVTSARIEARENGPTLGRPPIESPDPETRGIKQADLRPVQVSALVED